MKINENQDASNFNGIVRNALDFFNHALNDKEIKENPKYSLINFACGVELILKARLMHEHWSLILEDPRNANLDKFNRGDFTSVNTTIAIDRIENILNETLSHSHFGNINKILHHRNKLIHFFEPSYLNINDPKHQLKVEQVIKEECRTWYKLHNIITQKWKNVFNEYKNDFLAINDMIRKNAHYLEAKFDDIKAELDSSESDGQLITRCLSCGYTAVDTKTERDHIPIYLKCECKVCENRSWAILFDCEECERLNVYFGNYEDINCKCGKSVEAIDLINLYFNSEITHYLDTQQTHSIFCSECIEETVVDVENYYLCLLCFSEFKYLAECEWCNERYATDQKRHLDNSFLTGCDKCEGKLGWD